MTLRLLTALALLAAALPLHAATVLRVLAWPGYAEPEVVQSFEEKTGAHVELTVIDSDEAMWQKLTANDGADFDVFAVNTAELQRYIAAKLVQAVDPQLIPNIRRQLGRFRNVAGIPGLVHVRPEGVKTFAIPYTYSEMGLIYDRRQLAEPPVSIKALWDPRYRGKVIVYNGGTHNFSLAAQSLGLPSPFRIASDSWPRVVDQLIALRRNMLSFYNQPEESVRLFQRNDAALMFANYGLQQVHLLRAAGADVGYVIPREGALAWLDCWAITSRSRQAKLAHAWIDHMLDELASRLLVERQGLANTVSDTAASSADGRLLWLEPVEDAGRRELLWGRILSGDRRNRVLAP